MFSFDRTHQIIGLCFGLCLVSPSALCGSFRVAPLLGGDSIRTHPNLPKLPIPETLDQLQRLPWDLPHVFGFDGQVSEAGHAFVAGNHQATAEPRGSICTQHTATRKKEQRQREGDVQRVSTAPCRRQRQASEWHNNWKHSKHQSWEPAPLFSLSGGHMSWLQVKRFRMWPLSSILIIRLISLLTSHTRLILIKLERCDVALADELFTTGFLCNNLLSIFFLIAKTNRNLLKCSHFL